MNDTKLLEDGRRLKREIDDDYEKLYEQLSSIGTLKRRILAKERALRGIQDRLLSSLEMPAPSDTDRAKRKRMIEAPDDEGLTR
jgi:hypothetical protein